MRIVVTGADGFIGKNLRIHLKEKGHEDVVAVTRSTDLQGLAAACAGADFVFHLAGVNRPLDESEFATGNAGFTGSLCQALKSSGRHIPVVFASSTQAVLDNPYGRSKRDAEAALEAYAVETGAPVWLFRLPNVFGKWSRPNYNSAVATFCHRIARGQPIEIKNPAAPLRLVHIDDVAKAFLELLATTPPSGHLDVQPVYETTVGAVADAIKEFAATRETLMAPEAGSGLIRALYATYVSFLPPESFAYPVPRYGDPRGEFVEMLKTAGAGQFSYFTAHPGVTRGEHYHHSKTEKFLVIRGTARFGFRHVDSGAVHEIVVKGGEARIVETVPGWTHNITNTGDDELIVMLWANEIFDRARPDTIAMRVEQ